MGANKRGTTNGKHADISIRCEDYDFINRMPAGDIHVDIRIEDREAGKAWHLIDTVKPDGVVDGKWGLIANNMLDVLYELPSEAEEDWFDPDTWTHGYSSKRHNTLNYFVDWLDDCLWVGIHGYSQDLSGDEPRATLQIMGNGTLLGFSDVLGWLEPSAWFLPDYEPGDWIAHEGRFTQNSFSEGERDWTRKKILRGLMVAAHETEHYTRLARIYEEKTGIPVLSA